MPAPQSIRDLVQRFQSQLAGYHKASYNETELRRDFLDPFFAALGWDMTNTGGGSEKYREVIHEASVEVEGQAKAADYAFRMGGNNAFFVEAKKPAVNIAASVEAAFQLRSYGWSGKLALSLLTDFEQLAVYDCRVKPKHGELAQISRVSLYHFSEYIEKWDEIYSRYSREAVFTGKFDQFAGGTKGKKGTSDVDDAFLEMLEGWREQLAHNIALRNPGLSVRELNFAVQTTIDRIIFLRICEDRGIEADDALRSATDGKDIYQDLLILFKTADRKYNSGLFHFSAEKGEPSPADTLTPGLKIDDKVLKDILANLYHPSPYAFKYIPADILGQVYERFLGKVIRLTAGHQAKVEEKPEVRKAGGVYYTPTYIVAYIVKNTLGELLQSETPETQSVKPLRVLDPACGSGSFLLGAYQYLLDWYLDWYAAHEPARWTRGKSPAVVESQAGWQLTMEKKKAILLAHIFGVDIDSQAVEVTKLSLLLKVVENPGQLSLLEERILPDLGENVKCGNSLIGMDYYNGRQMPMFGDEELYRVNPFDWQGAFQKVFAQGGFDVVIGNPPYGAMFSSQEEKYLKERFILQEYQLDSYLAFIEKAVSLSKKFGLVGVIIPNTWLLNLLSPNIRKYIFERVEIKNLVHFQYKVFESATVDTEILVFRNSVSQVTHSIEITIVDKGKNPSSYFIPQVRWINKNGKPVNIYEKLEYSELVDKINTSPLLEKNYLITQGTKPFQVGKGKPPQTRKIVNDKPFVSDKKMDNSFRPLLRGSLIQRYSLLWENNYWISFGDWLAEPRYSANYDAPEKIVIRQTGDSLVATLDSNQFIVRDNLYTIVARNGENIKYLLALLNSHLLKWYYQTIINPEKGEALAQVKRGHLSILPIHLIDIDDPKEVKRHERIINSVESMLALHKRLAAAGSPQEKELLQRQIAYTDREIDALVYELYSLTDEEIRIVEGA